MIQLLNDPGVLTYIITGAVTFGTAFGGFKAAQNGINKRLDRLSVGQEDISKSVSRNSERLAVVETCLKLMERNRITRD